MQHQPHANADISKNLRSNIFKWESHANPVIWSAAISRTSFKLVANCFLIRGPHHVKNTHTEAFIYKCSCGMRIQTCLLLLWLCWYIVTTWEACNQDDQGPVMSREDDSTWWNVCKNKRAIPWVSRLKGGQGCLKAPSRDPENCWKVSEQERTVEGKTAYQGV